MEEFDKFPIAKSGREPIVILVIDPFLSIDKTQGKINNIGK
jgi:hypothetical protein